MKRTAVIDVVNLTRRALGEAAAMPFLSRLAAETGVSTIGHVTPALTCSVQATYLTGEWPAVHGIVGNGWYFRDQCEVKLWRQSNKLVQAEKVWETAKRRDASFTCANLFWWYNMYSSVDYSLTPRPMYPADGRKIPDVYAHPEVLRRLQDKLGTFPLFNYWGPTANIRASRWIADAAIETDKLYSPTLTLVYLPHMDYAPQKYGPVHGVVSAEWSQLDKIIERLHQFYTSRGVQVVLLSEYGISAVNKPVHINRALRRAGLLKVRQEMGREQLDAGASDAFAVADHQIAHIYVNNPAKLALVAELVASIPGVAELLDDAGKKRHHLDHPRAGDLVALAAPEAWFTYYFWLDDSLAPDYARTVDIHLKPGYDPVELFIDPAIPFPRLKIAKRLLARKLGFRNLLDIISLDASLVRGSHGVAPAEDDAPVLISSRPGVPRHIEPTAVRDLILEHIFD